MTVPQMNSVPYILMMLAFPIAMFYAVLDLLLTDLIDLFELLYRMFLRM